MAEFTKSDTKVYTSTTQADSIAAQIYVTHIRWIGPTTGGHILEIDNGDGGSILMAVADVDKNDQDIELNMYVTGLNLVDLDSGTVYVYVK